MSGIHAQSVEPVDVWPQEEAVTETASSPDGGEIVVECLEGQVAITASAKTQNLHAGEHLYLSAGEPHSVQGVEPASLLLSIQDPESKKSEENETMYARSVLLSVMQSLILCIALALLFVVAAGNVFAGGLVVVAALAIFGCLHYCLWGRWMPTTLPQPGTKERH